MGLGTLFGKNPHKKDYFGVHQKKAFGSSKFDFIQWFKSGILAKFQKGLEYRTTLVCSFKNEIDF